jgi:hypothetical protein
VSGSGSTEGSAVTVGLKYTDTLAGDPTLTAGQAVFDSTDAQGGILFEGATANGFETLVTVTEPTADRTITLPNETGTVCTTGSVCSGYQASGSALNTSTSWGGDLTGTGTSPTIAANAVTSTKILDGEIVNADINAAAAIALTKLSGWPANSSGVLTNNGSGTLTWAATAASSPFESATPSLASSTNWTSTVAGGLGSAAVNTGSGTIDLTSDSDDISATANRPRVTRLFSSDFTAQPINGAAVEVLARLAAYNGGGSTNSAAAMSIFSDWVSDSYSIYAGFAAAGNLTLNVYTGEGFKGTVATVLPSDGTGYVRLRSSNNTLEAFYGIGTSSTYPTTWTRFYSAAPTGAFTPASATSVGFGLYASSGLTVSASWDRIYIRSLLPSAP